MKATGSRNPLQRAVLEALFQLRVLKYISVSLSWARSPTVRGGGGGMHAAAPTHYTSNPPENALLLGARPGLQENCTGLLPLRRAGDGQPGRAAGLTPSTAVPTAPPSSPCMKPAQHMLPSTMTHPCPGSQLPLCKHRNLPLTHYQVTLRLLTPTTRHGTQDAPRLEELCGAAIPGATQGGPPLGAGAQGSSGYQPRRRPRRMAQLSSFPFPWLA